MFSCYINLLKNNFRNNNERKEKAKNAARDRRTQESDYFEVRNTPTKKFLTWSEIFEIKWVPENLYTFSIAGQIVNVYKFSGTHFNYM